MLTVRGAEMRAMAKEKVKGKKWELEKEWTGLRLPMLV